MAVSRIERVDALLKRVVGDAMFRIFQSDDVNPALITVTAVHCAKDLRNATIRVSVFGEPAEQKRILGRLIRNTQEFVRIINREVRMKFTPQLRFELDHSIEKGDRVLALLDTLNIPNDEPSEQGNSEV